MNRREKFNYFYMMANNMFWKKKSTFYNTFRTENLSIEDYEIKAKEEFDINEYLLELDLDPDERLWIRTYLKHNGSYTWISNATGISRQHCSIRINYIREKYKK